jgi:hypothetical protein
MSSLAWVASSEAERRRTLEVIRALSDPTTVDDLGLRRITIAISDVLFPGTTTIQTRARYFLLVPWLYLQLERKTPIPNPGDRLRTLEAKLIDALIRGSSEGEVGIIGIEGGANTQRLPAEIYWHGLGAWGIRLYDGDYHRLLASADLTHTQRDEDGAQLPGDTSPRWDPALPPAPVDLLTSIPMDLGKHEAEYLLHRITVSVRGSVLADLAAVEHRLPEVEAAWGLPAAVLDQLSPRSRDALEHAEMFSLAMHGAYLLYNLTLCEEIGQRVDDAREKHERSWDEWAAELSGRERVLAAWFDQLPRFWELAASANPRIPSARESDFIARWCRLVSTHSTTALLSSSEARALVRERERQAKGANGRFFNPSAREAWEGSVGTARLSFRWRLVQRLLDDTHRGLGYGFGNGDPDA